MQGDLTTAAWLIVLAGVLDFGDGFVARAVKVSGPFGKELDSLADVVKFAVLPSFILLVLLQGNVPGRPVALGWPLAAFAIAVCGALRLARFNIDTRQTDKFLGVPIPANAIVAASLPLIVAHQPEYAGLVLNPFTLYGYIVVMSLLMVSELPLMAFKFKSFAWAANRVKYGFLIASVLLMCLLQFAAIPLIILLYILLSLLTKE